MTLRRRTLLKRGGAGVAVVGGAAWYLRRDIDSRFWIDPPAFDPSGIETVTDEPVPTRPRQLSVSPESLVEPFRERVQTLLGSIPEPLSADTLPNGRLRNRIGTRRTEARTALDRARRARTTVEAREKLVTARERACDAATVWAAVSSQTPVTSVVPDQATVETTIRAVQQELPGSAPSPVAAAGVYGALAAPVEATGRVHTERPSDASDPLEAGRDAGYVERAHANAEAARLLAARYAETVSGAPTASVLDDTVRKLADPVDARFQALRRAATGETPTASGDGSAVRPLDEPDTDTFVDADVPAEAPSRQLLRDRTWLLFDLPYGPLWTTFARPGVDTSYPAVAVRQTHWVVTWLDALATLRSRIREGARLYPTDATRVRERRAAAVDAVDRLVNGDHPLERWVAWNACGLFERPDERLAGVTASQVGDADRELDGGEAVSLRGIAESYAEYDWIVTLAAAVDRATTTVTDAVARARETERLEGGVR